MNKFLAYAAVLIALLAALAMVEADPIASKAELVNEIEDDDEDTNQLDGGLGKDIVKMFGRHDVLEQGVLPVTDSRTGECKGSKDKKACATCCAATGKASFYALKTIRHHCVCFETNNEYKPSFE